MSVVASSPFLLLTANFFSILVSSDIHLSKRVCYILSDNTHCYEIGSSQDIYSALLLEMKVSPILLSNFFVVGRYWRPFLLGVGRYVGW